MSSGNQRLQAIPTNIITGFLGVGKTTAILHLLKQKPVEERWAVLVNEFGEIGVDGSLFEGQYSSQTGVYIREVPGGCMCCTAGLPMHIALNQLLARARPHRLLIEPTGLGHPKEILEVLSAEHYQEVLDIQKNITFVDARKLRDVRYREHEIFNQQIHIADVIVGNKQDLYQQGDKDLLHVYSAEQNNRKVSIVFVDYGAIPPTLLQGKSTYVAEAISKHHHHHSQPPVSVNQASIPDCGYIKVENAGEGYQSTGWRFSPAKTFDREKLYAWLSGLQVERMKAVFITNEGIFGYNATPDALTEMELDDCLESRVEIIGLDGKALSEHELLRCLVD